MISSYLKTIAVALLLVAAASAQNPDASANATVKGAYFVREVVMTGTADGAVTAAASAIGVATFDGNGNYTFKGQGVSLATGVNASFSATGKYGVGSNGFFQMTSLADPNDTEFGGVSNLGPSAFVASATERLNITMMVGIPIGSTVTNSSFKGNYAAGALDFPGAVSSSVREATFNLTADGAGNLGNVAISGVGANLGGTALSQTDSGVTYTLSPNGVGTINFGSPANSQLVSGSKNFYISADGSIILGGSPTGYDMLVGIQSLAGSASNTIANQLYYMAGFEYGPTGQNSSIDAFYGSENASGNGSSIFHNRINLLEYSVYDDTFDSQYTIGTNGVVPFGGDTPYQYTFGVNGQAFIGIGDAVNNSFYSLTLGLGTPKCAGSGVYLCVNGIVNSANFAPFTNPIAPNELITLFGTGLASAVTPATNLPLPLTLGGVTVTINGIAAPLDYVSPTQIIALVPTSISPANNAFYATVQVTNNQVASNPVTVYTNNTAPGVFANPVATGATAAQHANGANIDSNSPAAIGEEIVAYVGGLGAVSPPVVPDGGPAPSSPLSTATDPNIFVDFSGVPAANPLPFAGLTPTEAGQYQINVVVPTGTQSNVYFDVQTTDGYTSQTTLSVAGGAGSAVARSAEAMSKPAVKTRARGRKSKHAGVSGRASGPLP